MTNLKLNNNLKHKTVKTETINSKSDVGDIPKILTKRDIEKDGLDNDMNNDNINNDDNKKVNFMELLNVVKKQKGNEIKQDISDLRNVMKKNDSGLLQIKKLDEEINSLKKELEETYLKNKELDSEIFKKRNEINELNIKKQEISIIKTKTNIIPKKTQLVPAQTTNLLYNKTNIRPKIKEKRFHSDAMRSEIKIDKTQSFLT